MSGGPVQRAMPGSLKPALTHWESQRRSQLQYSGFAPRALQDKRGRGHTRTHTQPNTSHHAATWLTHKIPILLSGESTEVIVTVRAIWNSGGTVLKLDKGKW